MSEEHNWQNSTPESIPTNTSIIASGPSRDVLRALPKWAQWISIVYVLSLGASLSVVPVVGVVAGLILHGDNGPDIHTPRRDAFAAIVGWSLGGILAATLVSSVFVMSVNSWALYRYHQQIKRTTKAFMIITMCLAAPVALYVAMLLLYEVIRATGP